MKSESLAMDEEEKLEIERLQKIKEKDKEKE